jgi:hypothetical protein
VKKLTKAQWVEAEAVLEEARKFQTSLWDSLRRLEVLISVDVDANKDLCAWDINQLRRAK